ncbi:helix-turn-helix transcriptional regulator [Peribacillus sp. SIMBA_075]|uniref:helix-turn-helix domain-containing protein n=1 Tax=Peribacillus sp. SIMBA_075 TaxID=3085813 RepID=UPI00397CB68C
MHTIDYFCRLAKITNKDLANLMGCIPQQLNSWKTGRKPIPNHHKEKLCEIFNVPFENNDIFDNREISELDRVKIGIIIENNKLIFNEDLSESLRNDIERNKKLLEAQVEILEHVHELKQALKNNTLMKVLFSEKDFYSQLDKVKALVNEIKNNE